jgi:restriction system protein
MANRDNLISPHGGYKELKSFQATVIIYDLIVEFCKRYVPSHKMKDQLEGAARSGSQNIGEGSEASGTSKQTEIRLIDVARDSQEELKLDMQAFLRQHNLSEWSKDDPRAIAIRNLAYRSDKSHETYRSYLDDPEMAANCLLCLINQACYLLDQQLKVLGENLVRHGDFKDRYKQIRKSQLVGDDENYDELLKQNKLTRLSDGRVVRLDENENEK